MLQIGQATVRDNSLIQEVASMAKNNRDRLHPKYEDPFQSPRANPKHAHNQVNGETQQTYNDIVLQVQTRKRS